MSKVREVGQAGGVDRPELYRKHLWGCGLGLVWGCLDHQKVPRTGQPWPAPSLGKRSLEDKDVAQEDTGYRKCDLRRQYFHMLSGILSPSTATSTISSVSFLDIPFTTLALHKGHCPNQPRSKHKAYLTDHTAPVLPWDLICKNHTLTTKALLSSPLVLDSSNSSVPPALPVPSPTSFLSCNSVVHC